MVVVSLTLPSGLWPYNLIESRNQSQYLTRLEMCDQGNVHIYLDQVSFVHQYFTCVISNQGTMLREIRKNEKKIKKIETLPLTVPKTYFFVLNPNSVHN